MIEIFAEHYAGNIPVWMFEQFNETDVDEIALESQTY